MILFEINQYTIYKGFPGGPVVKTPPAIAGDMGLYPGSEDSLEKEMGTHSSILAWELPWTGDWQATGHGWGHKESDMTYRLNSNNIVYDAAAAAAKSLQLCQTLCNPIDGRALGSSVPGILQARILEWGAIAFWDSLGKSKRVGCHALLQGIFPIQGLNLGVLHCRQIL